MSIRFKQEILLIKLPASENFDVMYEPEKVMNTNELNYIS